MTVYLANAFSLAMLDMDDYEQVDLHVETIDKYIARGVLLYYNFVSAVGHPATAEIYRYELKIPHIRTRRIAIKLKTNDWLIVGQVIWPGGRMPQTVEYASLRDMDIQIRWFDIRVVEISSANPVSMKIANITNPIAHSTG